MHKGLDQWISYSAITIAERSGVPVSRIMAMRWVLPWKILVGDPNHLTGRKVKVILVVK